MMPVLSLLHGICGVLCYTVRVALRSSVLHYHSLTLLTLMNCLCIGIDVRVECVGIVNEENSLYHNRVLALVDVQIFVSVQYF